MVIPNCGRRRRGLTNSLFRHSRHTCFIDAHEEYCQVLTRWLEENDWSILFYSLTATDAWAQDFALHIHKKASLPSWRACFYIFWLKKALFSTTFLENWIKVVIFAATITVSTMGCERHKLHIYRTGNVEFLHFETSQMECGRLIREDQPAFFFSPSFICRMAMEQKNAATLIGELRLVAPPRDKTWQIYCLIFN